MDKADLRSGEDGSEPWLDTGDIGPLGVDAMENDAGSSDVRSAW